MDIDEVFTCSLDMCPVWELDVLLFECYSEFLVHLSTNSMLVETAEYLPILSLESECNTLPVEFLLYLECLFEADTCLVLASFFIGFDFFETFCSDLFCYPFWYEGITCLGCRDFDYLSLAPEMSDILEEFDIDLADCHNMYEFR